MVATSGDRLLAADAVEALRTKLIPLRSLITPNLPEAAALLDEPVATSEAAIERQGKRLLAMGCRAVLIKGGHGQGAESIDYLVDAKGTIALAAPRIATKNTHGTGCSLSSAIAAGLAKGEDMETAVRNAKAWISAAIAAADRFSVGHGHGPIHHFHKYLLSISSRRTARGLRPPLPRYRSSDLRHLRVCARHAADRQCRLDCRIALLFAVAGDASLIRVGRIGRANRHRPVTGIC